MKKALKTAFLMPIALLATALMTSTASAEMYKWTDKSGETHYTQTPPPPDAQGKNIEDDIRLSTGKLGNTIPQPSSKTDAKDDMEQARKDGKTSDQKHRDFCAQQEASLKQMTANSLIKWKDEKGERFLTADEKAKKMKEIQNNIDTMCKPEMFAKKGDSSNTSQTETASDARHTTDADKTAEVSNTGNNATTSTTGNETAPAASTPLTTK